MRELHDLTRLSWTFMGERIPVCEISQSLYLHVLGGRAIWPKKLIWTVRFKTESRNPT